MKRLRIHFFDTDKTLVLDENCDIFAWAQHKDAGLSSTLILAFDESLPNVLCKKPLMFYVYADVPILKLYRSVYIDFMEWFD